MMNDRAGISSATPLILPTDSELGQPTLDDYLATWANGNSKRTTLASLIDAIAQASGPIADRLALGKLTGDPSSIVGTNDSGDRQKALDVAAHEYMLDALAGADVRKILSEEARDVIDLNATGTFNVAIDPIDGSGSIGIGAPLGLLFAVLPGSENFQCSGRDVIAAGYVSFGHSIEFVFSTGTGVNVATYDRRAAAFRVVQTRLSLPDTAPTLAYNASNLRFWPDTLQCYIRDCLEGPDGPIGRTFNMRWLASAVGDLHRIMNRGGLFLYPADSRSGYEKGQLRLPYEAFPIAYLIEQAGGTATDGATPILDRIVGELHEPTPLIFGSRNEVATLLSYLNRTTH